MTQPILLHETVGDVAILTLNAPARMNALSDTMIAALMVALEAIDQDPHAKVVILRGAGKAFCAGHDLHEMQAARDAPDGGAGAFQDLFDRCGALMQMIPALRQPVIAQVHGIATAAGCQLVASCDMAIAAQGTRFGVNGINVGLFCATPMVALSRKIPRKAAFEMLTTGSFIDADRACALGLINRAVPPERLEAEVMDLATLVTSKLGAAVGLGKAAFYTQLEMDLAQAYAHTSAVMIENLMLRDTDEGMQAFLEKRRPDWA